MDVNSNKIKTSVFIIIVILLALDLSLPVQAREFLTEEEKAYIDEAPVIRAAAGSGAAPLIFADSNGEIQGIAKRVLDEITDITGLVFEYEVFDSTEEILTSDCDIISAISPNYVPGNMKLSKPFLRTETILFINSSLDSDYLDGKIYAAIEGSPLPQGIKEENSIYFKTREESLDAVEKGQADYGYGNAYSVAYYTLQNDYKNIITIPQGKESRQYCIGLLNGDEVLLSIIDKAIALIDETHMQTLILDVSSQVERKITIGAIMDAHGKKIFLAFTLGLSILLFSSISNIRANRRLKMQNKRHEALASVSNECLYEYHVRTDHLELSEKCHQLFGGKEKQNIVSRLLKEHLKNNSIDQNTKIIKLPLANGEIGVFKAVDTNIYDELGKTDSIIGKLIDISEEAAEREALMKKAQIDGLTKLYNAHTVKEHIIESIKNKEPYLVDAFILMDFDNFKGINDQHGHLVGDRILEYMGKILKENFRSTDIIGRIGGDEFCLYLKDVQSVEVVKEKIDRINDKLKKAIEGVEASVSAGISLIYNNDTYDDVFKRADEDLYRIKRYKKGRLNK